ncbi:MAG: efflux RND transporter periplasmic adaptor subunit [Thermodesulfobacteriota bacterium]
MTENTPQPDLAQLRINRPEGESRRSPARRWRRGSLVFLLTILVLGGGALGWLQGWLKPASKVQAATVSRILPAQNLAVLNATGYVVAQRKVAVASKGTGRLTYLGVEAGQKVSRGQVIARLENDDLAAAREEAEARIKAALAVLEQTQAEDRDAEVNYNRLKGLWARQVVSKSEYDLAEARRSKAKAGVSAARRNVEAARAALKQAEALLDYTTIRAPFDGVVLTKDADVGEVVAPFGSASSAKASVATLADMDSLMLEADVTESNIGKVQVGQPCQITLDALPDLPQSGQVHVIMPTADRSKGTIMVKVKFVHRDPQIRPEMSAKVAFLRRTLEASEIKARLSVHASALIRRDGLTWVFKLESEKVNLVEIKTGSTLGDWVEVVSGLNEGARVVLSPPPGLKTGDRVKVEAP